MRILVTGAAGKVGRAVVRDLVAAGHQVRALDRSPLPPELRGGVEMEYADITDRIALLRAADGCEAVAHLAAIPNPVADPDGLFGPNVIGTQYVLAAAEAAGIRRVALASSCSAYGFVFSENGFVPSRIPVSEDTPLLPEDLYGLSKQLSELTAAAYTRKTGMATTCLRPSFVVDFQTPGPWMRRFLDGSRAATARDLWGYIEVRDVARAFRLALEKVETGHHVLNIVARDLFSAESPRSLVERHHPRLLPCLGEFDFERLGFWSTERAEQVLGFVAEYRWRDVSGWMEWVTGF